MEQISEHGPWEDFKPQGDEHGPWEDFQRPGFISISSSDRKRIIESFVNNDPLGIIADADQRFYIESVTENLPDRDDYRKRLALAAFFTANNKKADYRFVLGNLDSVIEQYYKKKTTIDAAFSDIAKMYDPPKTTTESELGKMTREHSQAALSGIVDFNKLAAATLLRLGVWSMEINQKILSPILPEELRDHFKDITNMYREFGSQYVIKGNEEISQALAERANMNENFVTDLFKGDFDKVSVTDFTKAIIRSVPQMAFQLGLAGVAPWAGPAFIGTQTAAMKDYEVEQKQPDWGMVRHLSYVGLSAASEALLEIVTSRIARGALSRKAAAEIVSKGLLKYIGGSFSKEAATEAGQQIASNALDLFYDIEGDADRLSGGQFMARLFNGVPEAGFIGGVWGVPYGIAGYKNSREMMGAAEEVKANHRAKVEELSAKESLTDAEKKQLETSQEILENNSPQEVLALDHVSKTVEGANSDEQLRISEEFEEVLEKSAPGTTEEEIFEAVRAKRDLAFKATAQYDVDDVYSKVSDIAADFPGVNFVTLDSWAQLSEGLRQKVGNRGRAFYDPSDGSVYINASRVRPHEVLEVMLHEAVGHKGLQAVVPKAQLDQMLDKVYAAHFMDEDFQKIASRYFPDSIQRLVDEDGEEYLAPSLETPAQQREAAEEYIAHIAQKGVPKPNWWKEFLQQIRMFFRKFKWADDAVLLDSQIETVLARAARKVRRSSVVKKNLTTENRQSLLSETEDVSEESNPDKTEETDGLRFSLEEYSESDQNDIVAVLRPFVGRNIDMEPEKYRNYLKQNGIILPDQDADLFFRLAVMENSKAARERGIRARNSWIFENFPLFAEVAEFAGGADFKIKPVGHEGEDFTGSFISPEYVKYSIKNPQGKRSDKQYKNYIDLRAEKLSSASGFPIDEVASAVARKLGQDPDAVKEQILDFFRHLKKKDLYAEYSQFKKDALTLDKEEERRAKEEFMQQERFRIEDEAVQILTAGEALEREWIAENPKVFKEIYKRIFDGKEPPSTVSNIDIEAVNAALAKDQSTESFGPGYKEGKRAAEKEFREKLKQEREKAYEEYQDKLRALRDQVLSDKADAVKLQKEAASFAAKHLPYKNRGEFIRRIIQLLEMPSSPSARFPEGRRKDAFDKLLAQITERAAEVRKDDFLRRLENRLQQLGERVDSGRKVRGVRDMATQEKINRIIQITHLDGAAVNAAVTADQKQIEALIEQGESTAALEYDIALLNRYGEIWNKSADEVKLAFDELQTLAKTGRDNLLDAINARNAEDGIDRHELWNAVNGGIKYSSTELQRMNNKRSSRHEWTHLLDKSFWPTLSLDGMLDAMALFSDKENVVDRFRRLAHRAKLDKDTRNMQNSEECRSFLKKIIKTDSSIAVAETIGKWRQIQKQSGVRRFVPDPEEQQFKYERIPVDQARMLLSQYDAGRNNMPDYEAEAIRQQLAGIDRKIKYDVPEEFRDGFTDKLVDLIKKEMAEGKEPTVVVPHPTFKGATEELELSQLQALYLKLMWDQKDVRYKMRYNGYSDETMAQLDKFLLPEVKELGKWMVQQLESDRGDIEKVYKQMYFANFPKEENYFPSVYRASGNSIKASAVDITQEGSAAGAVAYTPGALKVRVYHLKDIDVADALTVFQNHRLLMNHFVTHAEPARKLRSVLLNSDVKQAIEGAHGTTAYSEMKSALKDFINGGNADVAANDLASHVYSAAVRTKMAFNLVSGLKQTLGALTYLQEIPAKSFMKGFAYAAAHPKEVIDTLWNTEYFKARLNSGANSELRLILDKAGRQTSKAAQIFNRIDEAGSLPLRFGDAVTVLFGGFSVYKYHYDNLTKQGMDKAEARKEALLKWEMATERTQQSNAPFLLNRFQRGNYMSRIFTTFMSNQILLWNHNSAALYKSLKYGSNAPLKDFRMGMTALVLSSAAMTAFDQLKEHWDDGEYEWMNLFWNSLADMVSGFGPIGSIISSAIQSYKPGGFPISPIWSDLFRGGVTIAKQIKEGELTIFENDWSDAVKILQSAGYLFRPAAQAGAVGREIRKWFKILNE